MDRETSNPRDRELVANLGWVQRLALSLARDRDAADELAQDVARVWLEKRPALSTGPRGWLLNVARKLALDRARSEVSRKARERAASRPEAENYEVVERGARQRRVVEAVMQLAEPYRSTILYRYLDALSTREVAERMNTNEAAVRKRVERGLALLRERLDREFGSRSDAWAVLLLEPGLRAAFLKGVGVMSMKWIAAAGALVLLAGLAWYLNGSSRTGPKEAVGGTGVVVPLEVAAARERPQPAADTAKLESAPEAPRSVIDRAPEPAPGASKPRVRGFLFVDEEHRAPADLSMSVEGTRANLSFDAALASWALDELDGQPARLWITSPATVPALIPIPPELCEKGGVFDLHLVSGRTLVLTFRDRETKVPLPNLEFQLSSSIELERSRGRVSTRSSESVHRTDAEGKATLTGVALAGYVSVTVDFHARERFTLMMDGKAVPTRWPGVSVWDTWLKPQMPLRIEQTIFASPPLGEAFASGVVPAWAGPATELRVVAREVTDDERRHGDPFLLPQDDHGGFELRASAPSRHLVWLERLADRQHLSAESEIEFARPGAQDPITFVELEGKTVTLRFVHVPGNGALEAWVMGKSHSNAPVRMSCQGADFTREFTLQGGEQIQLTLTLGSNAHEKSGWRRLVEVADERELSVDLGGCERRLRIEAPELGASGSDGAITLLRVESGEALLGQSIVALGGSPVHVPNGRWLYRYDDKNQVAVWGVVEVTTATQPGEELVLKPRLRLAPLAELQPGIRFDEIEGVSLEKLPEKFRIANVKGGPERVALPIDAKYVTLEGK